ncbi:cytochrome P450, family 82, subfamily F, polypeptide 1 [Actinidia rufa]|uniref:Cytochrome P450, family 82, subfamily F, polypeptide 1 n=1 Tax=Actinidia rufa TaxID=165716 RepID=A0A7J0GRD7_9ERIC|nr:cytochrome P450, family 82, subfamily F, polypeptide 1 [Actinidia rufa]
MADKNGPIFSFHLGVHPVVVVSDSEAIRECFTTNDKVLASRPTSTGAKILSYDSASFGFAPSGPYWREIRKLVVFELLSPKRLETLKHVRTYEIAATVNHINRIAKTSNKIVLSHLLEQLTLNIIVRMVSGKRYFRRTGGERDEGFTKVIKEFMYVSGEFSLSDVLPFWPLRLVDSVWKLRNVKRIMRELDTIVRNWIEEHVERRKEKGVGDEQDFIDVMLSVIGEEGCHGHTRETIIKATILNIILAGSDTTSLNLTWLFSLLLNNRHVLTRAQEELDAQVGKNRWVQDSDIKNLPYLHAIVKETLRLYPPGPLSVPHQATEDCVIGGYHVSKGTRLFANVWKLHRNPLVWPDPEKFEPERFLTSHVEVDVSGKHFEFQPFGSGRRSCPGVSFAMQVTHLTVARLLQGFDIVTPGNEPVDMSEGMGITLPKVTPLEVVMTSRLSSELYEEEDES